MTCEKCIHWHLNKVISAAGDKGLCRKNPPTIHVMPVGNSIRGQGIAPIAMWPVTDINDWCGDGVPQLAMSAP